MSTHTAAQSGDYNTASTWTPASVPALTDSVTIGAGRVVTSAIALGVRSANTQITGTLQIGVDNTGSYDPTGGDTEFGNLTINVGGALLDANPENAVVAGNTNGDQIVVNGAVTLKGAVGIQQCGGGNSGTPGTFTFNGHVTIYSGAVLYNCNAVMYVFVGGWNVSTSISGAVTTWTLYQYADLSPSPFTLVASSPWTDVAINSNLGGIGVLTTDYAGNVQDPQTPPYALVYRNGSLWNGPIQITWKSFGNYSIDLSLADGIWQLGDHGTIRIYWSQLAADGESLEWFCAVYYWLVNRLNYETWQRVTTALPAAAPGTAGGLPVLDANALAPETPHTAANLDAKVSAAAKPSDVKLTVQLTPVSG